MRSGQRSIPGAALLVVAATMLAVMAAYHPWTENESEQRGVIKWDVISYYAYLPATFIYGDVTLGFLDDQDFVNDYKFWIFRHENGNYLIQTSMGVAYLYSPFFFAAHLLAPLLGAATDGFSPIYQLFLLLSAFFFTLLGLIFLKRILLRYFSPLSTGITLLLVGLGTNLFFYTVHDGPMAHSYSFSLITIFLYMVIRWYESPTMVRSIWTGLLFGLIVLIRPSNLLAGTLLLLWGVTGWRSIRGRIRFLLNRFHLLLIIAASFIIPWVPQMIYWKTVTGSFLFNSYGPSGSSFYFGSPHILEVLFSYRKGWYLYTPVMLAATGGLFFLGRRCRQALIPVTLYLLLQIYLLASWWSWWNGGSFGLRSFVDIYGVMALPLAALVEEAMKARKPVAVATGILLAFLLYVNQFQTYQYTKGVVHYLGMTREAYWLNFLRFKPSGASWQMLMIPDFELARLGIYYDYYTGTDDAELKAMEPEEGRKLIRKEIESDPKLVRQIRRHAVRTGEGYSDALGMVVDRVYQYRTTH